MSMSSSASRSASAPAPTFVPLPNLRRAPLPEPPTSPPSPPSSSPSSPSSPCSTARACRWARCFCFSMERFMKGSDRRPFSAPGPSPPSSPSRTSLAADSSFRDTRSSRRSSSLLSSSLPSSLSLAPSPRNACTFLRISSPSRSCSAIASLVPSSGCLLPRLMARRMNRDVFLCFSVRRSLARSYSASSRCWRSSSSPTINMPSSPAPSCRFFSAFFSRRLYSLLLIFFSRFALTSW